MKLVAAILIGVFASASSIATTSVVYSNNFDTGEGLGFSSGPWTSTSSFPTTTNFLGPWDNFAVQLTLNDLTQHSSVSIDFDLYVMGSVYGNFDPAIWSVSAGSFSAPNTLSFSTTFSNVAGYAQAYPDAYPSGNYPAQTGAIAISPFYYGGPNGVTAYHLNLALSHDDPTLLVKFEGQGFLPTNGPTFGRWGLDNVQVSVSTVPEPSSYAFYLAGLGLLSGLALPKRKKISQF